MWQVVCDYRPPVTSSGASPESEPARSDATLVEFSTRVAGPLIEQLAAVDVDVLLLGERGVGKERIARELHGRSLRHASAFVVVNCESRPAERLEVELFGPAAGGVTRRTRRRNGALDDAAGGTIYLDEVDALPPQTQARLFDALENQQVPSAEGSPSVRVFPRVIASAITDLARLVSAAQFRLDLYERLRVVTIAIPPLRERREELPGLVHRLLAQYAGQYGGETVAVTAKTMESLVNHSWPGNVPQLENIIERIALHRSDAWVAEELERASVLEHRKSSAPAGHRARPARRVSDRLRSATPSAVALPSTILLWAQRNAVGGDAAVDDSAGGRP